LSPPYAGAAQTSLLFSSISRVSTGSVLRQPGLAELRERTDQPFPVHRPALREPDR
jgi:hypothetical protein